MKFKHEFRDWMEYRKLPNLLEQDFHWMQEERTGNYYENMQAVWDVALLTLKKAQQQGKSYVLFTHGWSSSRIGKTTARSQVRKLLHSKEATPYVLRRDCIEHNSVFVAAIRPLKSATQPPGQTTQVNLEQKNT